MGQVFNPIELPPPRAAAEVQKEVQCQQFRELLKEKEREIEELATACEGRGGGHGWGEDVSLAVGSEVDVDRHVFCFSLSIWR